MKQRVFESRRKTLRRQDNLSSAKCFFVWALAPMKVPPGSFFQMHRIFGNFSKLMQPIPSLKTLRQASLQSKKPIRFVSLHPRRGIHLAIVFSWMNSTTVWDTSKIRLIEACLAIASARAVRLSPSVQNRNWNWKSPTRVEAETWKFARQRGSSPALGTRGLYVL